MDDDNDTENENEDSNLDKKDASEYVDANTDLVPGTYEGGLKTWEGGMDLVEVLNEAREEDPVGFVESLRGKRFLEVSIFGRNVVEALKVEFNLTSVWKLSP